MKIAPSDLAPYFLRAALGIACRSMAPLMAIVVMTFGYVAEVICAEPIVQDLPKNNSGSSLQIKMEASRVQSTVGTGLGIQAELQNTSNKTIYLQEKQIALTVPPEILGSFAGNAHWWGTFPTQHTDPEKDDQGNITRLEDYQGKVTLAPGAVYRVQWAGGPDATVQWDPSPLGFIPNNFRVIASELNFIFFSPGDYRIAVVAQYWDDPKFPPETYSTATQTATIRVATPQSVILLGSALGGLIAYPIFPRTKSSRFRRTVDPFREFFYWLSAILKNMAAAFGAMLLSAIVTILLARISETQFLIRVTVSDFWGAIAIGFIANYVGVKIFERLLPGHGASRVPEKGPTLILPAPPNDASGRRAEETRK